MGRQERRFYEATLAPLGLSLIASVAPARSASGGEVYGFGPPGDPLFWVGDNEEVGKGTHVAFRAGSREAVEAFHAAALAAGGRDNGPPGLRPQYAPGYFAAFVLDPDGINVEAVFHEQ